VDGQGGDKGERRAADEFLFALRPRFHQLQGEGGPVEEVHTAGVADGPRVEVQGQALGLAQGQSVGFRHHAGQYPGVMDAALPELEGQPVVLPDAPRQGVHDRGRHSVRLRGAYAVPGHPFHVAAAPRPFEDAEDSLRFLCGCHSCSAVV